MSGEISVFSGEEGQKLVTNFLKVIGWNVAGHIQFECIFGEKHKTKDGNKNPRKTHNIDAIFQYDSPLMFHVTKKGITLITPEMLGQGIHELR